jgi:uncharacterized protein (TIGR03503 family)
VAKLTWRAVLLFGVLGTSSFGLLAWQEPAKTIATADTAKDAVKEQAAGNANSTADKTANSTGIHELPAVSSSNQIPLLDNRFRIDYAVEELTLVFFRKKGSPSIVLVQPDGSKIYARTALEHGMQWHDDKTYDLIKMVKPVPGPWQAIGDILPESRIMVLTDIDLKVDPLPKDMMVGESLKVTAKLTNGGKPINARDFRDILQLNVLLISTQKPEYDNFTSTVLDFTTFKDDGRDYDERPRDAIFTGEFKLDFPAGEWMPKYIVETPLYSRELLQDPLVVSRTPISTTMVEAKTTEDKHVLTYTITEGPIDAKTLSLQGRILFPSQEVQSFTIAELAADTRELLIANAGTGTYRITQTVFGKTKSGREFVISLPEVTFAALGAKEEVPAVDEATVQAAKEKSAAEVDGAAVQDPAAVSTPEPATPVEPEPEPFPLGWVIFGNIIILLVGGGAIFFSMSGNAQQTLSMIFAKLNPKLLLKRKQSAESTMSSESASAGDESMNMPKKPAKAKSADDILDLSLPDD